MFIEICRQERERVVSELGSTLAITLFKSLIVHRKKLRPKVNRASEAALESRAPGMCLAQDLSSHNAGNAGHAMGYNAISAPAPFLLPAPEIPG